jgi:hypothetical protein
MSACSGRGEHRHFARPMAQKAMRDNLQSLIDRKLLDPNNAQEMASAVNALTKQMEDLKRSGEGRRVAAAAVPIKPERSRQRAEATRLAMVEGMNVNRGFFVEFGQQLRQGASAWDAFKSPPA